MTRYLYGADGGTVVTDAAGNAITGRACQVWTQSTAGAQVTDTQTPAGVPTGGTITTDDRGRVTFLGPDSMRATLWVDAGDGTRWAVQPADTDRVARAEVEAAAVLLDQVGQPGGVASLGVDGTVPADQLPDLSGTYLPEPAAAGVTGQALLLGADGSPYWGDAGGGTTASWAQLETATAPRWIAHRGGSLVLPENTLDAFMGATQLGVDAIELDVWLTRDGGLYVMHDGTVDRTTNLSGNTKDQTIPSVARGRIDAATWFSSTWPSDLRIPTLDDVLQRISPLVPLILHVDDTFPGAGAATVAAVQQHERTAGVLIACWSEGELAAARAAGIPTLLWTTNGSAPGGRTYTQLLADGTQYLGCDATGTTNATMQDAMNAGMRVVPFVVDRRYQRAALPAGVWAIVSNDPWYAKGTGLMATKDSFATQTFDHGMIGIADQAGYRGDYPGAPYFRLDMSTQDPAVNGSYASTLQGWGGRDTPPATWTLDLDYILDANKASSSSLSVYICAADDREYDDQSGVGRPGGYAVLVRQSGIVDVYKVTADTPTKIGTVTTAAITTGTAQHLRIAVTATTITVTRTNIATPNSVAVTDSTYRGGYWHLGSREVKVRFGNIILS